MSLISEALTKTRELEQRSNTTVPAPLPRTRLDDALRRDHQPAKQASVQNSGRSLGRELLVWLVAVGLVGLTSALVSFDWPRGLGLPTAAPAEPVPLVEPKTASQSVESPTDVTSATEVSPQQQRQDRFRLTGVLYAGEQSVAVLNDTVLSLGQEIDDATLTSIGRDHVHLSVDGEELRVPLSRPDRVQAP